MTLGLPERVHRLRVLGWLLETSKLFKRVSFSGAQKLVKHHYLNGDVDRPLHVRHIPSVYEGPPTCTRVIFRFAHLHWMSSDRNIRNPT